MAVAKFSFLNPTSESRMRPKIDIDLSFGSSRLDFALPFRVSLQTLSRLIRVLCAGKP